MKNIYLTLLCFSCVLFLHAQYMSRSQPVPFACPTVCPGSVIVLDIPQVQNLNSGDTIQAWFSNSSGSFSSGTTTLNSTAYSLNTGTNWTTGAYTFSSNINDLYIKVTIPANMPAGSAYTIKMKTSSGYVAGDLFSCSGSNYITVTSAYPVLGSLPITAEGTNQWVSHVYTWTPTTGSVLNTPTLVNQQDFFNANNYQGYFLKDSLSFDINFNTASGGSAPGQPGSLNDGTNIPCSKSFSGDFSFRMLRKQNFAAGTYKFSIQGDDGIRLSIDGGNTWLLSSFLEQIYSGSYKTSDSVYPNGICLSGPTDLVIEFFQRNVDTRLTFTATMLSGGTAVTDAGNQHTCAGGNVTFTVNGGTGYQWYYSTNGGSSFSLVPNSAPFSGVNTASLTVNNVTNAYNNYIFYCSINGVCTNAVNSPKDTLFVDNGGGSVALTASKLRICPHNDSAVICGPVNYASYLWNNGATTQCITTDTAGDFWVSVAYRNSCTFTSNHVHISVFPPVTPILNVTGGTITVANGTSVQWYDNKGKLDGDTSNTLNAPHPGSFYVTMIDSNGCPEQSAPVSALTTGLNDVIPEVVFSVYPNPVTGSCVVTLSNSISFNTPIHIYNELGQLLLQQIPNGQNTVINLQQRASGIYFFRVNNNLQKVVKL